MGSLRRHANLLGITLTGTLGVLLKAKERGHISQIAPMVARLTELGFHLSAQTRDAILNLANETSSEFTESR